ncbi:BRCT domain-containing protein [Rhodanobacter lindaniclasticus]|uniref:NAD-dependent DNA ligase n=1 Tax=Rhodanobacter lindaniclasticus TaxID=75310 RepID=A0A4S3K764_9GAMM|nr:BRCT domain-containing protein [Rhodanobacter lindaniclasticus]THD03908.1 NAD-dependent DNA ligase [Rhodanobacter lindaniclasticus]
MHEEHKRYFKLTGRSRIDKSINSLLGIIEGIAIDSEINASEVDFLHLWLEDKLELRDRHPFNELIPVIEQALADRVLTEDEKNDIVWLCERLTSNEFYDQVTTDLQRLHAIVGGIVADTSISEQELRGLSDWIGDHEHLRGCWPYDEIGSLVTTVLVDKVIDEQEHEMLFRYFSEFVALLDSKTITNAPISNGESVVGLCAVCPEIEFQERTFAFTGASARYTRRKLAETVSDLGGHVASGPGKKVDYLVIGADGNPCWAFACYGRKVEKAVELRKSGVRIMIIHESYFHDAVLDAGKG